MEFECPLVRGAGKGLAVILILFYDHGRGWNVSARRSRLDDDERVSV